MKSLFFASFLFLLAEYSFAEELINYTITSDSQTNTLEGDLEAKGNVAPAPLNLFDAIADGESINEIEEEKMRVFLKMLTE